MGHTRKFGLITIPSILGPKSVVNLGGLNLVNSLKCLLFKQSKIGS